MASDNISIQYYFFFFFLQKCRNKDIVREYNLTSEIKPLYLGMSFFQGLKVHSKQTSTKFSIFKKKEKSNLDKKIRVGQHADVYWAMSTPPGQ